MTIFGQSAGAQSTRVLLGSQMAAGKGLFRAAIASSDPNGACSTSGVAWAKYASVKDAYEMITTQALNTTKCLEGQPEATDQIACLIKYQYSGSDLTRFEPEFR